MKNENKNKMIVDAHTTELLLSIFGMGIGIFGAWSLHEYPDRFPESIMLVVAGITTNLLALRSVWEKTRCAQ